MNKFNIASFLAWFCMGLYIVIHEEHSSFLGWCLLGASPLWIVAYYINKRTEQLVRGALVSANNYVEQASKAVKSHESKQG